MFHGHKGIGQKLLDAVDLTIDLATLGEYGLEPLPADGPCRELTDRRPTLRRSGWEALPTARRGACGHRVSRRADFRGALDRFTSSV
jgi:hypothetical protein